LLAAVHIKHVKQVKRNGQVLLESERMMASQTWTGITVTIYSHV